ncbi:hypothetical protein SDRG_16519 [Saprolegnia diclina VS20]|uniref:Methyltransferase type 11 domain-containing protein n=1 Tax=Saprolegnia diclina (strain VS20) TaxID=1156394 RepID=T0R0W4_SAPDV|nr:hypothetical protein SDRG_16519 [Saprolegnia diclina VS20]EQC25623.1 hypothetical protein SDRG_16519 [Saprolegnia diclina VS20]|eukprot:XP_008620955.1 hypothetical protein SDRG_16519 [Saprolegnia diclina VS20]
MSARPCVISKGFYERVLPSASVDLVLSYVALHWLSKLPTPLPGSQVTLLRRHAATVPDVALQWQAAAHSDLVRFLQLRVNELCDNGVLCTTMVADLDNPMAGTVNTAFNKCIADMVTAGIVSTASMEASAVPTYFRAMDDVRAAAAAVPELQLRALETVSIPMPFGNVAAMANFFSVVMKPAMIAHMTDAERADPAMHEALADGLLRHFDVDVEVHGAVEPLYKHVSMDYIYASFTRRPRVSSA